MYKKRIGYPVSREPDDDSVSKQDDLSLHTALDQFVPIIPKAKSKKPSQSPPLPGSFGWFLFAVYASVQPVATSLLGMQQLSLTTWQLHKQIFPAQILTGWDFS